MYCSLTIYVAIPVGRQVFFQPSGEMIHRCVNGHLGDTGVLFCQTCGNRFQMEPVETPTELFAQLCARQGWDSPAAGFDGLLGNSQRKWTAVCSEEGGNAANSAFQILLAPINVEGVEPETNEDQVYGLAILIAQVGGMGEDRLTTKVLEVPLDGFPRQAATLKEVAAAFGVEGEPALYPQVSLSY